MMMMMMQQHIPTVDDFKLDRKRKYKDGKEEAKKTISGWYYEKRELRHTPSIGAELSWEQEVQYRREGARFILQVGNKMGLRYETMATGVVYFHRFYMVHTFQAFPRHVTACCCLFLAGKVEETPKKCRDIMKTAKSLMDELTWAEFGTDPREEVMTLERILLQTIKFDFIVEHPYTYLLKYAKCLKGDKKKLPSMVQMAWTFVNDSLCTTLCLQWEPEIVAIALMYLAGKLSKFEVMDWAGRTPKHAHWWDMYVEGISMDLLEDICHQVLDLYSPNRSEGGGGGGSGSGPPEATAAAALRSSTAPRRPSTPPQTTPTTPPAKKAKKEEVKSSPAKSEGGSAASGAQQQYPYQYQYPPYAQGSYTSQQSSTQPAPSTGPPPTQRYPYPYPASTTQGPPPSQVPPTQLPPPTYPQQPRSHYSAPPTAVTSPAAPPPHYTSQPPPSHYSAAPHPPSSYHPPPSTTHYPNPSSNQSLPPSHFHAPPPPHGSSSSSSYYPPPAPSSTNAPPPSYPPVGPSSNYPPPSSYSHSSSRPY